MSKFFASLLNSKNKTINKENNRRSSNGEIEYDTKNKCNQEKDDDSPPIMARKMSLTKSGRMKEKKLRRNMSSVTDHFSQVDNFSSSETVKNKRNCDSDDDVFNSSDDVVKELHQIGNMEITAL